MAMMMIVVMDGQEQRPGLLGGADDAMPVRPNVRQVERWPDFVSLVRLAPTQSRFALLRASITMERLVGRRASSVSRIVFSRAWLDEWHGDWNASALLVGTIAVPALSRTGSADLLL